MIIPPVMLVDMVDERVTEMLRQAADYRRARQASRHRRALRRAESALVCDVTSVRPRGDTKSLENAPSHCDALSLASGRSR
jgi:hypothetical protein